MCVLAFAWRAHPRWRLVVAGNRDERHARPAADLAHWPDAPHILAGRDLQSGGSWLGVSEQGRFAVVTNVRGGPISPAPKSRGALVADFLRGAESYDDLRGSDFSQFNAFNLILADGEQAYFLSNRPGRIAQLLAPGLHGLANGALDAPWPKTLRLKAGLEGWLASEAGTPEELLDQLRDESMEGIPQSCVDAGPDSDRSPIFIRDPVYGTRCSTIVLIDEANAGLMIERRYSPEGAAIGQARLPFRWPSGS